jgi:prolyl-tRNA synthetase
VHLIQMKVGAADQDALAEELHTRLEAEGVDVLWDDRKKVSPGAKFKDADLVGIPLRIVVGRDAAERRVEWTLRAGGEREVLDAEEALERAVKAWRTGSVE